MSNLNLDFDIALSEIYHETKSTHIDPIVYLSRHFDLLRNQVDIFTFNKKVIDDYRYLKLIEIIKNHEDECLHNCHRNLEVYQEKLKDIIEKVIKLNHETQKTKEFVEKRLEIRKEWIETRQVIFKKNLIFVEFIQEKEIGSLVIVEPFCLDDQQTYITK